MRLPSCLLLALLIVCGAVLPHVVVAQSASPPVVPPSPAKVAAVVQRDVESLQAAVGTIEPARRSIVGSAVDGRVIQFPRENGDRVLEGDTLAQLRTETLEWQLAAAQAELTLREHELAELQNGTEPETIANLEARMKAAEAQRDYTQSQLSRIQGLYARGQVATQTQLDEAQSLASGAMQDSFAAKSLYDLAVRGPRQERIAQAQARCEIQKAVINQLKDQIARHTVVAPFDGFIVAEHSEVGQWASSGDPIVEVVQLSEVNVRVNVLESQIASLRIGQRIELTVPAAPQTQWFGVVHRIIPQADVRSRTFPVDVRVTNQIDNDAPVLKSGLLASVRLPVGTKHRALLVPKDALVLGGPQPVVFVLDPDPTDRKLGSARPVPVAIGVSVGKLIEVTGPLEVASHVIVEGNERLKPGERVQVLEEVTYD
ncbi:MAG: efflux RND transporter periplasmic adaptor subunit [Planctomycetaceae bacterium]|nr:efflux RND transporter periplasmic adaptor subunit [Planctomycetaceae bacterium]